MANIYGEFKVSLVGRAFMEYSEFYRRMNAQLIDEMSIDSFNIEIYKLGMTRMIQLIKEAEDANKLC